MLATSLEPALDFAEKNKIPRVIEIKCPRPECGKTVYALTDGDLHEHAAWLAEFKNNRFKRHVYCKHCSYGATGDTEGHFVFKTHYLSANDKSPENKNVK